MKNNTDMDHRKLTALSFFPGIGHLLLGRRAKGLNLLFFTLFMIFVIIFRWESFVNALFNHDVEFWIAPAFIFVSLTGLIIFSIMDIKRILAPASTKTRGKSLLKVSLERFSANKLAVVALYLIIFAYIFAFLAPILATHDPNAIEDVLETRYLPPSMDHILGTDEFGRDLLSRALYGGRISLAVGFLAMIIAISFGTIYGAVAAYFGKVVDNILMRAVDIIIAFPTFFLLLMLVGIFEANVIAMVLILGLTSWTGTARFIRGEILSLKEREFIEGAKAIGLPNRLILLRHLIPNAMAPVLVSAALMVGNMIGAEAGLSFLGIGIRPPTPTWGNMMTSGRDALAFGWWIAFFPGGLLSLTILCFNFLADGLRDALDPKTLMRRYI